MLIVSFADLDRAEQAGNDYPAGLMRIAPRLLLWRDADYWPQCAQPLLGLQGDIVDRRSAQKLSIADIAKAVATKGAAAFIDWAAPFRMAWQENGKVHAAADHCGLGHWFVWQASGVAAISDRATTIARRFGLGIDDMALAGLALTGSMVGSDSIVAGVKKVGAGKIARIGDGCLSFASMSGPSRLVDSASALTASVSRLSAAHSDVEIELSGGWDSRLLLAAMPASARQHCSGFTIGNSADPDVVIATKLADYAAMRHTIVDQSALGRMLADEFAAVIHDAAERDDFSANPLDRAGINVINACRPPFARFSGQNGEILRGFYYPGQQLGAVPSVARAAEIIGWRLISNDLVNPSLFNRNWLAEARATTTARLTQQLLGGDDSNWASALDRYYLEHRMQRWFGTAVSATLGRRPVLLPFFDEDVLAMAREIAPAAKNGSRFVAQEIARLDTGLAAIALDSGMTPAEIAGGGLSSRIAIGYRNAGKIVAKLRQRLAARDRPTMGSAAAGTLALRHSMNTVIGIDRLVETGIFDMDALASFANKDATPSRATLGFVLNVDRLLVSLARDAADMHVST